MKAGKYLLGKEGAFTSLMKEFLEAPLEGEMTSHMNSCLENPENQNRYNGKGWISLFILRGRRHSRQGSDHLRATERSFRAGVKSLWLGPSRFYGGQHPTQ